MLKQNTAICKTLCKPQKELHWFKIVSSTFRDLNRFWLAVNWCYNLGFKKLPIGYHSNTMTCFKTPLMIALGANNSKMVWWNVLYIVDLQVKTQLLLHFKKKPVHRVRATLKFWNLMRLWTLCMVLFNSGGRGIYLVWVLIFSRGVQFYLNCSVATWQSWD